MFNTPKLYCFNCFSSKKAFIQLKLNIIEKNLWESLIGDSVPDSPKQFEVVTEVEETCYEVEFVCPVCKCKEYDLSKNTEYDDDTETITIHDLDPSQEIGYKRLFSNGHTTPEPILPSIQRPSKIKAMQDA